SFAPQHLTVLSPSSAQLWCHHPAVTSMAPVIPRADTGVAEDVVVPSPNWPKSFWPQHCTVPLPRRAHVCRHPAVTARASVIPTTCTVLLVVVPSPSCPNSLSPQHCNVPSWSSAHV